MKEVTGTIKNRYPSQHLCPAQPSQPRGVLRGLWAKSQHVLLPLQLLRAGSNPQHNQPPPPETTTRTQFSLHHTVWGTASQPCLVHPAALVCGKFSIFTKRSSLAVLKNMSTVFFLQMYPHSLLNLKNPPKNEYHSTGKAPKLRALPV